MEIDQVHENRKLHRLPPPWQNNCGVGGLGRLLYFPRFKPGLQESLSIDAKVFFDKIIAGEAYLVGVFWYHGGNCSCYRLEHDNEVTYIFDVTPDSGE